MKKIIKTLFIFLLMILCINNVYADEPKFTCVYNDFKLDPSNNNGKGLQINVYNDYVKAYVYYKDTDGGTKTYDLDDCKSNLTECEKLWDKEDVSLNLRINIDNFYENTTPHCPNAIVDNSDLYGNGLVLKFGKKNTTSSEYETEYIPRKEYPHGSDSGSGNDNVDETVLECTNDKGYSYSFSTSEVPNASHGQISFEFLKKKSGKILIRVTYGSTMNEYTVGDGSYKELESGNTTGNARVKFDSFGSFNSCPSKKDLSFCEADIAGENFKTFAITLNDNVCKSVSTKIPGYNHNVDDPKELECESIFTGDLQQYLEKIFSIMKYLGIVLCIGLSIVDFVKAILDDDKNALNKITKRVLTRLLLVALLFFLPTIVNFIVTLIDSNACKINF